MGVSPGPSPALAYDLRLQHTENGAKKIETAGQGKQRLTLKRDFVEKPLK